MYDLSTEKEKRLTYSTASQKNPCISGDKVVFEDNRNGNEDIYMYDCISGNIAQITFNGDKQVHPAISKDKIVWTDDRDNFTRNIYMAQIGCISSVYGSPNIRG